MKRTFHPSVVRRKRTHGFLVRMRTRGGRAVELTVAKNRHGDTGKVGLIFRPDLGTLREEAKP